MSDAREPAQDRERITVTLTPQGAESLAAVTGPGRTKTDAVNRALRVYAFLEEQTAGVARPVRIPQPDGTVSEVRFI